MVVSLLLWIAWIKSALSTESKKSLTKGRCATSFGRTRTTSIKHILFFTRLSIGLVANSMPNWIYLETGKQ